MEYLVRKERTLAYQEAGRGTPPIVLLHNLQAEDPALLAHFEHFRLHHRTVAIDLQVCAQGMEPLQNYPLSTLADDLNWLCRALGLHRPVLVGLGAGGDVAEEIAGRHPDLPGGVVAVAGDRANRSAFRSGEARESDSISFPHFLHLRTSLQMQPGNLDALIDSLLLAIKSVSAGVALE